MHDSRQIEQTAAEWLARCDAEDWTPRDQCALDDWLSASAHHRVAFIRLQGAWREVGRLQALAAGLPGGVPPPRSAWQTVPAITDSHAVRWANAAQGRQGSAFALRPRKVTPMRARWTALAATLVLAVIGSFVWAGWQLSGRQQASYASIVGQIETVVLTDGSTVTLGSNSQLQVSMSRSERRIALTRGEVYFDVAHDAGRPFVVEAADRHVIALGTRFSVRRDPQLLRVVVTEGKVRLDSPRSSDGRSEPVALLPAGSVATASSDGVLVRSLPVREAERYLSWRSGFLTFDDTPLQVAVTEFNRFNSRKLELADSGIADLRVGGNFRWDNAESFVGLLELGFPVNAERYPDRIVLHSR